MANDDDEWLLVLLLLLLLVLAAVVVGAGLMEEFVAEAAVGLLRLTSVVSTPRPTPTPPSSNEVGASDADSLSDKRPPPPQPALSSTDDEAQLVFDSEAFEVVLSACISHICSCRMSSW